MEGLENKSKTNQHLPSYCPGDQCHHSQQHGSGVLSVCAGASIHSSDLVSSVVPRSQEVPDECVASGLSGSPIAMLTVGSHISRGANGGFMVWLDAHAWYPTRALI